MGEVLGEDDVERDLQTAELVDLDQVVDGHAFVGDGLGGVWVDYFLEGDGEGPAVQSTDLNRQRFDAVSQLDLVPHDQVLATSLKPRVPLLLNHEHQVAGLVVQVHVAFELHPDLLPVDHAPPNKNFLRNRNLLQSPPIVTKHSPVKLHHFPTATIQLFQAAADWYDQVRRSGFAFHVHASHRGAKQAAFDLFSVHELGNNFITFEKILKNLISVVHVPVASFAVNSSIFQAELAQLVVAASFFRVT